MQLCTTVSEWVICKREKWLKMFAEVYWIGWNEATVLQTENNSRYI